MPHCQAAPRDIFLLITLVCVWLGEVPVAIEKTTLVCQNIQSCKVHLKGLQLPPLTPPQWDCVSLYVSPVVIFTI